jgi:hypothetical protein
VEYRSCFDAECISRVMVAEQPQRGCISVTARALFGDRSQKLSEEKNEVTYADEARLVASICQILTVHSSPPVARHTSKLLGGMQVNGQRLDDWEECEPLHIESAPDLGNTHD